MGKRLLFVAIVGVLLAACTPAPVPSTPVTLLGWDHNPDSVIFQQTRFYDGEDAIRAKNRIPLCTLYGNNHIVWTTIDSTSGEQVYEYQVDDATINSFLEFLIRDEKFYEIPDYGKLRVPPAAGSGNVVGVTSMLLNLNNQPQKVTNTGPWPNNTFDAILKKCSTLSSKSAVYAPAGAWVSAVPLSKPSGNPAITWPTNAQIQLRDVVASGTSKWLVDPAFTRVWQLIRSTQGQIQFQEGGNTYLVALEVPGFSLTTPLTSYTPAPAATANVATVSP